MIAIRQVWLVLRKKMDQLLLPNPAPPPKRPRSPRDRPAGGQKPAKKPRYV